MTVDAPIDPELARRVAGEWLDAWNRHDLEGVLGHYADDVEFTSPFAVELSGQADGTLRGIDELRTYFSRALAAFPELRFTGLRVATGVSSMTLCYRSVRDLDAAETMFFGDDGKIVRVVAHYEARAGGD
jgi:ketosteroid isomerase-like protein